MQEQSSRREKDLKAAVLAKTNKQLAELQKKYIGLLSMNSIEDVRNQLNGLIKKATASCGAGRFNLRRSNGLRRGW